MAETFLEELGEAMTREMTKGGPIEAIIVCTKLAPDIAGRLSREHGWRVTRVGTRVRNPLLGMPDAWEQRVLAEFTERAAKGKAFADMTHHEVVAEPAGQYFRFMKPIVVQPKCLFCHGSSDQIPESIRIHAEDSSILLIGPSGTRQESCTARSALNSRSRVGDDR